MFDFSSDKKRLISNFFSLSSVEAANYIFPLITLPYLVRVLGPEKYGLINFAAAFIYYFVLLTDYGFNLSATREVSINRENKQKVLKIFNSVMFVKLILMIISLIIMLAVIFFIPKFRQDRLIYVYTFGELGWRSREGCRFFLFRVIVAETGWKKFLGRFFEGFTGMTCVSQYV